MSIHVPVKFIPPFETFRAMRAVGKTVCLCRVLNFFAIHNQVFTIAEKAGIKCVCLDVRAKIVKMINSFSAKGTVRKVMFFARVVDF
jgi:hypothetical protein